MKIINLNVSKLGSNNISTVRSRAMWFKRDRTACLLSNFERVELIQALHRHGRSRLSLCVVQPSFFGLALIGVLGFVRVRSSQFRPDILILPHRNFEDAKVCTVFRMIKD